MKHFLSRRTLLTAAWMYAVLLHAQAQLDPLRQPPAGSNPLTQPTLSSGALRLMQLDAKFAEETERGGGKAFAAWFADDAVALNNGKSPTLGKTRIAATANWDASDYRLTWQPQGALMGPSGDMGYTWGHYDGTAKDNHGNAVVTGGRYITVWVKAADGTWKVSLDASADEPPAAGDCCKLSTP